MASVEDVTATLIDLADTLVSDYDLVEYLERLLEYSTGALDTEAGGVMLSDLRAGGARLQLMACTDVRTRSLELFELQEREGPCMDSHRIGAPVIEEDLLDSDRWPVFGRRAVEEGYRAVYAFPMRLRDTVIGALNLFRVEPGPIPADDVRLAQTYAHMATIGIMQQRAVAEAQELAAQLQVALHSRVVIEQAKGVLAERLSLEIDEAYLRIRSYSRNHNRRLREVAAAVVAGDLAASELAAGPQPA
jgi:GAF domain-containing protein